MKNKKSSWGWFWQSVTGILLILLVGLHMIAHHFVAEGGIRDFQQVIAYLSNPIIILTELAFLISVTVHAMLGMRSILFDLGLSPQWERVVTYGVVVIGGLTVLYGFWLTYAILAQGSAPTAFLFR
ncbi:MAG: hypothetical protein EYC68_14875 [Chloroflexota bacterium]|nr:MAG: hypothetical protein EYC68_14875 [Chloroflexota bacterium]